MGAQTAGLDASVRYACSAVEPLTRRRPISQGEEDVAISLVGSGLTFEQMSRIWGMNTKTRDKKSESQSAMKPVGAAVFLQNPATKSWGDNPTCLKKKSSRGYVLAASNGLQRYEPGSRGLLVRA